MFVNVPFRLLLATAAVAACAFLAGLPSIGVAPAAAQTAAVGPSGLPLPRFVSLKSSRVNSRIGPGLSYPVDWLYLKPGLPMEVIQEFDNWRRVRDAEGAEGWINQSLLSGRRTGIVAPWQRGRDAFQPLLAQPREDARVSASVEPGAMASIRMCNGEWCELDFSGQIGWMRQTLVWGAYPGETIKR